MKQTLCNVMLTLAMLIAASASLAQPYPTKPIRIVIGFPAGIILDFIPRIVGNEMAKPLGQPIVLEFKPGASGTIGAKYVVNANADGYTLLFGPAVVTHPILNRNNAVDAGKDLAPISHFATTPYFFVSKASLPVSSVQELVAYAKANPDSLKHGTPSATTNLVMQMLMSRTGINSRSIPYKSSAQVTIALLAAEVDWSVANVAAFLPYIQAGTVRALFVASAKRSALLPNVPTAAEFGVPNFEVASNYGLWAPLGTPRDIIQKLSAEAANALKIPAVVEQLRKCCGVEPVGSTPEELMRTFESDIKFLSEAARQANYQPQ